MNIMAVCVHYVLVFCPVANIDAKLRPRSWVNVLHLALLQKPAMHGLYFNIVWRLLLNICPKETEYLKIDTTKLQQTNFADSKITFVHDTSDMW